MGLDLFFSVRSEEQIGYYRKVNFLVKYFLDRGYDIENQTPTCIDKEDIEELLSRCNQVLEDHSKASELLPTMGGFFFGNTDYNEHYFIDIHKVKGYIEDILLPLFDKLKDNEGIYFEIFY